MSPISRRAEGPAALIPIDVRRIDAPKGKTFRVKIRSRRKYTEIKLILLRHEPKIFEATMVNFRRQGLGGGDTTKGTWDATSILRDNNTWTIELPHEFNLSKIEKGDYLIIERSDGSRALVSPKFLRYLETKYPSYQVRLAPYSTALRGSTRVLIYAQTTRWRTFQSKKREFR